MAIFCVLHDDLMDMASLGISAAHEDYGHGGFTVGFTDSFMASLYGREFYGFRTDEDVLYIGWDAPFWRRLGLVSRALVVRRWV